MERKQLTCHCGAVELSLRFPNGMGAPRRCNCSMCARRGAVVISVNVEDLEVVKGHDAIATYTFNTHSAKHHFCKICGIYTHHHRRSTPTEYGVNTACVEGVQLEDHTDVPIFDGRDNHPSDAPTGGA